MITKPYLVTCSLAIVASAAMGGAQGGTEVSINLGVAPLTLKFTDNTSNVMTCESVSLTSDASGDKVTALGCHLGDEPGACTDASQPGCCDANPALPGCAPPPIEEDDPCPGKSPCVDPQGYPNTTIFDIVQTRNYIPGCLYGNGWGNCGGDTSRRSQGNMSHGRIYSARVKLVANSSETYTIEKSETGEAHSMVSGWVSALPGRLWEPFNYNACKFTPEDRGMTLVDEAWELSVISNPKGRYYNNQAAFRKTYCVVPADVPLYVNFTVDGAGANNCGNSGYQCRLIFNANW